MSYGRNKGLVSKTQQLNQSSKQRYESTQNQTTSRSTITLESAQRAIADVKQKINMLQEYFEQDIDKTLFQHIKTMDDIMADIQLMDLNTTKGQNDYYFSLRTIESEMRQVKLHVEELELLKEHQQKDLQHPLYKRNKEITEDCIKKTDELGDACKVFKHRDINSNSGWSTSRKKSTRSVPASRSGFSFLSCFSCCKPKKEEEVEVYRSLNNPIRNS